MTCKTKQKQTFKKINYHILTTKKLENNFSLCYGIVDSHCTLFFVSSVVIFGTHPVAQIKFNNIFYFKKKKKKL